MENIYKIQEALEDCINVKQALEVAQNMGIAAHIENGMLVLDGIVVTQVDGKDPVVTKGGAIENALDTALSMEAMLHETEFMPAVVAIKGFNPSFDGTPNIYEVNTQWKVELLQEPEPPCLQVEHEWLRPVEVVGGSPEKPGVWPNSFGGESIAEICPNCGMTRYTDTVWQDMNTGTVWQNVVKYDAQVHREAALQWAASQAVR